MSKLNAFKKDKLALILIIIIFSLGIFLRVTDYSEIGYISDDQATILAGVLWFYPHNIFPGLASDAEPPFGDFLIGAGCMLSGEDFSGVSKVNFNFYPGREILVGKAMSNADFYCHLPIFIFGILFLIAIFILAVNLLEKYSAIYLTSFFAFFPFVLMFSRITKADIILWFLVVLGLLFLFKMYISEKNSNKELKYLILTFIIFGLAQATKEPATLFFIFGIFLILEKYKEEILDFLTKENKPKIFIKNTVIAIISFTIALLIPYKLNPKNLITLYQYKKQLDISFSGITLNKEFFKGIFNVIINLNVIDLLLFFFSLFIFIKLLFKKNKSKHEKFILYFVLLYFISLAFFRALILSYIAIPYFFSIIILIALAFSDKEYSLFNIFKIKNKKIFFTILIIIYIIYSFSSAYAIAPYYEIRNPILCHLQKDGCEINLAGYAEKKTVNYLKSILNDNETFIGMESAALFYIKQEQGYLNWIFEENFKKQFGREATLQEKITYFKPNDWNVRYVIINAQLKKESKKGELDLKQNYKPIHIIKINNKDVIYIYDVFNLTRK